MIARWRKRDSRTWRMTLGPVTCEVKQFVGVGDRAAYDGRASWRFGVLDRRGVMHTLGQSGPRLDDLCSAVDDAKLACEDAAHRWGLAIVAGRSVRR